MWSRYAAAMWARLRRNMLSVVAFETASRLTSREGAADTGCRSKGGSSPCSA